ncbi:MAG: phosphotransferase [Candidatus Kariarchaeaceae archaeon]|jgi:spectinomycin phosphotransferase
MVDAKEILTKFNFLLSDEPESIYKFAPVFKFQHTEAIYVLKKTRSPLEMAENLHSYTRYLKENNIDVVTPISLDINNPQDINGDIWVIYEFIEGTIYSGKTSEIFEAGRMLGQIHAISSQNRFGLKEYGWYDFSQDVLEKDLKNIKQIAEDVIVDIPIENLTAFCLKTFQEEAELKKKCADTEVIPWVGCNWDYKANNLVYLADGKPVLIDPDSGGFVPRIIDLALALLLFNNDLESAPPHIFTTEEWSIFLGGYTQHICFTKDEKEIWLKVLLHVFTDEVIWLLANHADLWQQKNDQEFFISLIDFLNNYHKYQLF